MTQLTRKQQSGIQQLLEKERNERLYGRLPDNSPTEILNILGANKEPKGGFMDMLHDLFIGTKRTEFPEVPELTDKRIWETMGGDPEQLYYGVGS